MNVTNLGDPVNGWTLAWTFPSGQRVTHAWNATVATSGSQVTATNMSYNATIATNATVSFGFNGAWSASNTAPDSFSLNGVVCTGNVGPTATPTASPSPSISPSQPPSPSVSPSESPTPQPGDPMAMVTAMQPGWNLGNTFDANPDETSWGNPRTTQAMLHHLRSQGYNSIRSRSPGATTTDPHLTTPSTPPG
ncbi:cellulose binding domain-containing protein [Micromonospora sp. LOL_021]|uniref:cellulose binding domain-containing protein n=1 Tax=Micromonospora sp. LOL_021 TaxID=3345417 RepID=UPI003A8C3017